MKTRKVLERLQVLLVLVGLMAVIPPVSAISADLETNRRNYLYALEAIKAGNIARYQHYYRQLDGYILQGHLQYEYLRRHLTTMPKETIRTYLVQNKHSYNSSRLRIRWLYHLASTGDWTTFNQEYINPRHNRRLTCYRLGNLLKTGDDQAAVMAEIQKVWLTHRRLPAVCRPVITAWRRAGHMTKDLVWQRIRIAMEHHRLSLAARLARYLDARDRIWAARWRAMHRRPARMLDNINYPVKTQIARTIIRYGIVRIGYRDPKAAMERWQSLKTKYQFYGEDDNYVLRWLGVLGAQDHIPESLDWLAAVSAEPGDNRLLIWRVKAAIHLRDWEKVKHFISALPEALQQDEQWRYWMARALESTGEKKEANKIYSELATSRSYYGFLAADRLGAEYSMRHEDIKATPEEVSALLAKPGIQIAQELYAIGQVVPARRQWNWITRKLNNRELQVAALVAQQWGWHDRALYTVNKSDHLDDLDIRFPVLYRQLVEKNAERQGIDSGWMYGIMRQESAFMADARSPAGALGLMQLMPRTGREAGRRLRIRIRSNRRILDVETNISLGARHLKTVLHRHNDHLILATAAYNAGSHRVKKWLPDKDMAADIWVESIPFNETRNYVKNVMAFTTIYMYRLGKKIVRLQERMRDISVDK